MQDITIMLSEIRAQHPSIEEPELLRSLLERLVVRYFFDDSRAAIVTELLEHLFDDKQNFIDVEAFDREDRPYLLNILSMRQYIGSGKLLTGAGLPISTAPQDADCIVGHISDWPLLKVVNFVLLLAIPATFRAALVTSIRNEGTSILEWIAHHRALGFDHIFVYTNNNTDGSTDLLENLAELGVIQLINNVVGPDVAPQIKAYEHSTHLLPELRKYRWAFYLDADEFFIPRCEPKFTLDDFFRTLAKEFSDSLPSAISFNWKWFGSENVFERSDGLLLRRFVHSIHNEHVKTLVQLNCVLSMKPLHCPIMFKDCSSVNSEFEPIPAISTQIKPVYGSGQVNHYWNKSFEEFMLKKFRGRGAVASTEPQRDYSTFFDWGVNNRRGNFDPPPELLVDRTQAAYDNLLRLPGVLDAMSKINECFIDTIADLDKMLDLRAIYRGRGRV